MLPQEIIRRKRDGLQLTSSEIQTFVTGLVDGSFDDAQVAAMAMAIFQRGMDAEEAGQLTRAMTGSGQCFDWKDQNLCGPVLDKHSTGGVGDKVSLALAPIVAAAGGFVPMISGRGLGHTGGTLDKLEAIPGYTIMPDPTGFQALLKETGCLIIGQSAEIAPADRRLYAIRDVTATVESLPLITASILSKKLAAGLDALVMDVKWGKGAFASDLNSARALARSLIETAAAAGLPTQALITDMNQVLGLSVGNALEVRETLDYLAGKDSDDRFHALVMALAEVMLAQGGLTADPEKLLSSGAALESFERMVVALGGRLSELPEAPLTRPVFVDGEGFLAALETRDIGMAIVEMGGGRRQAGDSIDPVVGFSNFASVGQWLDKERPLAVIHGRDETQIEIAAMRLREAVQLSDQEPSPGPVILESLA